MKKETIEINEEFGRALDLMKDGKTSVFVTGKAGTGKSTLLRYFRDTSMQDVVVLAPTGVAAVNVGGQTIHSFFGFKPDITPDLVNRAISIARRKGKEDLYKEVETIVVDEVSMVRADIFDCMDLFLRGIRKKHVPFGGVQMIMIGDLYQLPPVVTSRERAHFAGLYKSEYFFASMAFADLQPRVVELEKIYRQKDERFIKILNAIRNNSIGDDLIAELNLRHDPEFVPDDNFGIYLTTLNEQALHINEQKLSELKGKTRTYEGAMWGDFKEKDLPTERMLKLKVGAQVMLLNNDSEGRWVNGTIGRITKLGTSEIEVELADGFRETVDQCEWDIFNYELNESTKKIESKTAGSFIQFPIKLAWAITIHKSQGKTFDRCVIDLARGTFAPGQAYVALSRCRSLSGIVLKHKFQKKHVIVDWRIVNFLTQYQYMKSDERMPLDEKITIIKDAIQKRARLNITYLKSSDEKSRRVLKPISIGEMSFKGKSFLGMVAFCQSRGEERTFRVDRILEMKVE